jgi:hypothetical protein
MAGLRIRRTFQRCGAENEGVSLVTFGALEGPIFETFIVLRHANEFHLHRALSALGHRLNMVMRDRSRAYGWVADSVPIEPSRQFPAPLIWPPFEPDT